MPDKAPKKPCIYCKDIDREKNIEHVIPQLLGLYGSQTMTLYDMVCQECNSYFSEELELSFGRDSVYGILYRAISGLFSEQKFSKSIRHHRKKLFLNMYYPKYGTILVDVKLNSDRLFEIRLAEQFNILNSTKGICVHYPLNQLPHRSVLDALGLPMTRPHISYLGPFLSTDEMPEKVNQIHQKIQEAGINQNMKPNKIDLLPPMPNDSPLMFSSTIDDTIIRTIAKIGFNYFAYNVGYHMTLSEYFNDIRNYIRYGIKTNYQLVRLTKKVIRTHIDDLPQEKFNHHTITIYKYGNAIMAKVVLFNQDIFDIVLSNNYPFHLSVFFKEHKFYFIEKHVRQTTLIYSDLNT